MQLQTEPTNVLACESRELSTTEGFADGEEDDDLVVVVTARFFAPSAVTKV